MNGINSTGLRGKNIMKFVEDLYLAPNIYDNFVVMLDKSFPSPIHDNFKAHYQYVLQEDSIIIDDVAYYRIAFQPRHKHELAFTGEMLVHKATLAVKKIELRFDIMANVNFVRSYWVSQEYDRVDGTHWMPVTSQVLGDFTVLENAAEMTGFFGRKNSTYYNYQLEQPIDKDVFKGAEIVVETDSAYTRNPQYWEQNRQDELTDEEKGVFTMVDQLQKDPAFIKRAVIISAITTGYVPLGKVEVGDFYTFYSNNVVEHSRVKFGFRTSKRWEIPLSFSAYGAYGTFDEKWKYGGNIEWKLNRVKKNRTALGFAYKDDIEQLGRSFNSLPIDHLFTSLVQLGRVTSRVYTKDLKAYVDHDGRLVSSHGSPISAIRCNPRAASNSTW
ncbi:MAG: hypothetical protein HC859_04740 [Bacteroidia bacterium]|nr:hypothetical protein [Bacteroidia bacterium]